MRPVVIGLVAVLLVTLTGWASWHFLSGPKPDDATDIVAAETEIPMAEEPPPAAFQQSEEQFAEVVPTVTGTFEASAADQTIVLEFEGTEPKPAHDAGGLISYRNGVTGESCWARIVKRSDSLSAAGSPVTYSQIPDPGLPACPTPYLVELVPVAGSVTDYGQVTRLAARWLDPGTGRQMMSTTLSATSGIAD